MRKALSCRLLPIKIKSILIEGMAFPSKRTGRAKRSLVELDRSPIQRKEVGGNVEGHG
ncbi:hypothetical protein [Cytobacillus sp. FSL H8-0458]|uniref:hypothetical protein n=1 Tax=Cytobacillus sp. FSL H8-0458 TaxID=2975346 RepID=UPI0030F6ED4F